MFGSTWAQTQTIEVDSVVEGIRSMTEADIAALPPDDVLAMLRAAMKAHNRAKSNVERLSRYRNLNPSMRSDKLRAEKVVSAERAAMQKLVTARR